MRERERDFIIVPYRTPERSETKRCNYTQEKEIVKVIKWKDEVNELWTVTTTKQLEESVKQRVGYLRKSIWTVNSYTN